MIEKKLPPCRLSGTFEIRELKCPSEINLAVGASIARTGVVRNRAKINREKGWDDPGG